MKKQEVIEAKLAKRKPAKNGTPKDSNLFAHELEKTIPNAYVIELSNVYLLNGYLLDFDDFKVYNSYTHTYLISKKRNILNFGKIILSNFLSKTKNIENAILATDNWSNGYFHWLTDVLSRILVAQKASSFEENTELLLPKKLENYDFVEVTGLKLNQKLKFYEDNQVYRIKKLILPSHIAESGNYDKELIQKIRQSFNQNLNAKLDQNVGKKIYISRQKSRYRKVNNEEEV